MDLSRKKILFVSSNYFGYYKHIITALQARGASVDWYSDTNTHVYHRILSSFKRSDLATYDSYYEKVKLRLSNYYDIILIIKGDVVPFDFLDLLKDRYKNAQFILYLWDDVELSSTTKNKFHYFDRILSYNIIDCQKYNLILRPVFYASVSGISKTKTVDVSIIGSYNSIRGNFIKKFRELNSNIELYSHYYINPLTFISNKLKWSTINEFKFYKLPYNKMMELVACSKACLDVPHSGQQGLTTRSVEALPFDTKIITTNPNIKLYDYYSPINHYIVDLNNPVVEFEWLEEPYDNIDEEIIKKYTIDSWISDVFSY